MARTGRRGESRSIDQITQKLQKQLEEIRKEIDSLKKRVSKLEE